MYGMSTKRQRKCICWVIPAVLAFALSPPTSAFSLSNSAPAIKVSGPTQAGAWTVFGWSKGYCSGERPLPEGAGVGATFVFARLDGGYRIALAAEQWELKPQTAFRVELVAQPAVRNYANALAVNPKMVVIELGVDRELLKGLLQVKTAQTTFKLPMEGFDNALAAVDSCFAALKAPNPNPFAAIDSKPNS